MGAIGYKSGGYTFDEGLHTGTVSAGVLNFIKMLLSTFHAPSNDGTRNALSTVTGRFRILFITLSEIIWVFMNDHGTSPEIFWVHPLQGPSILSDDGIRRLGE